jgi:hypothetical protein
VSGEAALVWSFPPGVEAAVCSIGSWLEWVISRSCVEKWGRIEVAAAVFPTGCPNSWVLALLEVISRSCVGLAREKGSGVRKCEGLVELAEAEAMGHGQLAATAISFLINFSVKCVKSSTCNRVVSEKGPGAGKCEGLVEGTGDGQFEAKARCFFINFSVKFVKSTSYDVKRTDGS